MVVEDLDLGPCGHGPQLALQSGATVLAVLCGQTPPAPLAALARTLSLHLSRAIGEQQGGSRGFRILVTVGPSPPGTQLQGAGIFSLAGLGLLLLLAVLILLACLVGLVVLRRAQALGRLGRARSAWRGPRPGGTMHWPQPALDRETNWYSGGVLARHLPALPTHQEDNVALQEGSQEQMYESLRCVSEGDCEARPSPPPRPTWTLPGGSSPVCRPLYLSLLAAWGLRQEEGEESLLASPRQDRESLPTTPRPGRARLSTWLEGKRRRLSSWVDALHSTPMDRRLRRASCLEGEPEDDEEVFFPG